MPNQSQTAKFLSAAPLVAGTVHTGRGLRLACRMKGRIDLLEIRVDAFSEAVEKLRRALARIEIPRIITVRDSPEGGCIPLKPGRRKALFDSFLGQASFIDLELGAGRLFATLIEEAKERGIGIVLSHHDFKGCPSPAKLARLAAEAARKGGDIFKVAAMTNRRQDLAVLEKFLADHDGYPLSVMGMGRYGKISRLLFGATGSVLNYGYLDRPIASGQWPAEVLRVRLDEVLKELL